MRFTSKGCLREEERSRPRGSARGATDGAGAAGRAASRIFAGRSDTGTGAVHGSWADSTTLSAGNG